MEYDKSKYVRWVFTSYDIEHQPQFNEEVMQCMIFSKELGKKNQKLHWQGAFQLKNRNGMQQKSVVKLLWIGSPNGYVAPMNGRWDQSETYCSKEDTHVEGPWRFGTPPAYGNELKAKKVSKIKTMFEGIKAGKSKKQLIEEDPDTYIRNHNAIDKVVDMYYKPTINKKYKLDDFCTEPLDFTKSMVYVIKGASGIGKTQFALAHFDNPLFVSHIDDLKKFDGHDGIVIDDMDFSNRYDREFQIHLIDTEHERSLHARHWNARRPANVPMIFTTNTRVFMYDPAIERRHKEIEYKFSLFKDKNYVFEESQ